MALKDDDDEGCLLLVGDRPCLYKGGKKSAQFFIFEKYQTGYFSLLLLSGFLRPPFPSLSLHHQYANGCLSMMMMMMIRKAFVSLITENNKIRKSKKEKIIRLNSFFFFINSR
jgi:hypothetical protein